GLGRARFATWATSVTGNADLARIQPPHKAARKLGLWAFKNLGGTTVAISGAGPSCRSRSITTTTRSAVVAASIASIWAGVASVSGTLAPIRSPAGGDVNRHTANSVGERLGPSGGKSPAFLPEGYQNASGAQRV